MATRSDRGRYRRFRKLDGTHPFRAAVPNGFVDYPARRRRDGEVAYFNFALAKEMGLIARDHPKRLTRPLCDSILAAFALVIVNEYDVEHDTPIEAADRLQNTYMATRYLQLQHPGRVGATSGDGRSIWNGSITHGGTTWDVTSCGTGVTQLCPATGIERRFFKTGTTIASYGCGTAALAEGIGAALMSETLQRNGIATERVLAVIALPNGRSINVRAGRNLMRPSHLFVHLKQNDLEGLRGAVDYFAARQISNGDWPALRKGRPRYQVLAEQAARTFAQIAATFESEYIFCWLEWDGDNILADGGIIDYGSVRQFGLYHHEYRFNDEGRMSTTLREQRAKARRIVQNFAQIRDFLSEGKKTPLARFAKDPVLDLFDAEFDATRKRLLMRNVGFDGDTQEVLLRGAAQEIERFQRVHRTFERARSARGRVAVTDGINWNAIYSTRDLLRRLPRRLLAGDERLSPREFLDAGASTYASRRDRAVTPHRARMALEFQRSYRALIEAAARLRGKPVEEILGSVVTRSAVINRFDRITGDSIEYATTELVRNRNRITLAKLHGVIDEFVRHQSLDPDDRPSDDSGPPRDETARRVVDYLIEALAAFRHNL